MPNIPYPEFNDFRLDLSKKVVSNLEPVEGFAFLSMNDSPNCVKDILIALRSCFRYRTDDGTTHTVLLHEEIQRNSTPFDDAGLPEGEYEFPFSFTCPENLPPSVLITGGWDTLNNCKIWYEIRAYVMHAENHAFLDRKHLRTSVKFQRVVTFSPESDLMPGFAQKTEYQFGKLTVNAVLEKDIYNVKEPLYLNLTVNNELLRSVSAIKISVKQVITVRKRSMRQVKEFVIKHQIASVEISGKGVPIKRHQTYSGRIAITPKVNTEESSSSYGGVALAGKLNNNDQELSSSIFRHTPEGIEVSYYVQVNLPVLFGSDSVVTIPFILSHPPPENDGLPSYWQEESQDESHAAYKPQTNQWTPVAPHEPEDEAADEALPSYNELISSDNLRKSHHVAAMMATNSVRAPVVDDGIITVGGDTDNATSSSQLGQRRSSGAQSNALRKRLTVQMSKPMMGSTDEYANKSLNMDHVGPPGSDADGLEREVSDLSLSDKGKGKAPDTEGD